MHAAASPVTPASIWRRAVNRLPSSPDRRLVVAAWVTLIVQIGIVGTGGLVRLTGSGLGCPTWPRCTVDSLVTTPEMGIHGIIEFGNRSLTFVLAIVAIVTFVLTLRMRRERRDLFWLSLLVGLYIPAQAVIGGITVLTKLNPYVVGLHFFASVPLVALAAALVVRVRATPGPRARAVPRWYAATAYLASVFVLLTVAVGILVTGSGPHAGDEHAIRNGLNSEVLQHLHAVPAYILFALTVALLAGSRWTPPAQRLTLWSALLLGGELAQITIGLIQANTGLPIALVNIHMVLAVSLVAAMTTVILDLHRSVPQAS